MVLLSGSVCRAPASFLEHSALAKGIEVRSDESCGTFFPVCEQKPLEEEEISVAILKSKILTQASSPPPSLGRLGQWGAQPPARSPAAVGREAEQPHPEQGWRWPRAQGAGP